MANRAVSGFQCFRGKSSSAKFFMFSSKIGNISGLREKKKKQIYLVCNKVCGNCSCSVFLLTSEGLKYAFSLLKLK